MLTLKERRERLAAWAHATFGAEARAQWPAEFKAWARRQVSKEALSALLHVAVLLILLALTRPLFFQAVDAKHYEAWSIYLSMVQTDLQVIAASAPKNTPTIPQILTFLVPMFVFLAVGRKLRWTDWDHGKALRIFVCGVLLMLCWSGATSPYHMYLDRSHGLDRLILVACGLLTLRFPIFAPLTAKLAIVMIKEAYIPTLLDDFDFRAPAELVSIFGVFVWCSLSRTFRPAHFLIASTASFASFYYLAGVAKARIAGGMWFTDNHVSNLTPAGYVRGWLSFVPEHMMMAVARVARELDWLFQSYTLFIEVGAILGMFAFRRLTRWWYLGCAILNLGIFVMSGINFWKWMTASFLAFFWMGRRGKPLVDQMFEYRLPHLLAIASIYFSSMRIWFFPTPVAWFDTRLTENYEIYAIGESGQRYLVPGTYFRPSDMHWSQGALCYATNEHSMTGIYATGSYGTSKLLDKLTPEQLWKKHAQAKTCKHKNRARYDKFMKRFFKNINRYGGRRWTFLEWFGRPKHIWIYPKGSLNGGDNITFDAQEKVKTIELWVNLAFLYEGELHRTEPHLAHTVEIPQ